jgi:hypothetical protein
VRAGRHRGGEQALGNRVQLEAPVEPVGNGAEVALGVLSEVEGMVGQGYRIKVLSITDTPAWREKHKTRQRDAMRP